MADSTKTEWWSSEDFWRKCAIFVTVINYRIGYEFDEERNEAVPTIGPLVPLFGEIFTEEEARALVDHGKLTVQARNCMNCHTFLGNGAYYAPDLTKAWLDPLWGNEQARELLMTMFLKDPPNNARTFGTNRKMPNLTDAEIRGVIAYLKWMSAIDTNGFPQGFTPLPQDGPVYEEPVAGEDS